MQPALVLGAVFVLGAGAVGAILWSVLGSRDRGRQRLATLGPRDTVADVAGPNVRGVRPDAIPSITRFLGQTEWLQNLQIELIRGGWMLRPSEFVGIVIACGAGAAGLVWFVTRTSYLGIIAGIGMALLPYGILKSRQQRRNKMLSMQIPDSLDMLGSSLRSGFALLRAMQVVRAQMRPPIAEEFGRVVDEVQYGIPLEEALDNLILRTGNQDLELIVTAVQTQLSLGGNLAEIFDNIAGMIRERVRLLGELSAATAEGRLSAGILLAMPFVMVFLVSLISPGYLAPLFQERLGLILIGTAIVLMTIGALVMRKLIDIDV